MIIYSAVLNKNLHQVNFLIFEIFNFFFYQFFSQGGRVVVYQSDLNKIDELYSALSGDGECKNKNENFLKLSSQLKKEIETLEPDCVLFNFECCSGCSTKFPKTEITMKAIKWMLDKSFMIMFSDFAVKALVNILFYFKKKCIKNIINK